jgi:hypothetical protein
MYVQVVIERNASLLSRGELDNDDSDALLALAEKETGFMRFDL